MNDEVSMPADIVEFSEKLISGELDDLQFTKIYEFDDDEEAHDDEFQERKHREFEDIHKSLVEELSKRFGNPSIAETEDEFDVIPLYGVFPAAMWDVDGVDLFLAISHEERETPILLFIGTS